MSSFFWLVLSELGINPHEKIPQTPPPSEIVIQKEISKGKAGDKCQESTDCEHGNLCNRYQYCESYIDLSEPKCSNSDYQPLCVQRSDGAKITVLNNCWITKMDVKTLHEGACQ